MAGFFRFLLSITGFAFNIQRKYIKLLAKWVRKKGVYRIAAGRAIEKKKGDLISHYEGLQNREKNKFSDLRLLELIKLILVSHYFSIVGYVWAIVIPFLFLAINIGLATRNLQDALTNKVKSLEIVNAPGSGLLRVADFLYRKETVKGVFEQIVGDWREEYFMALKSKRTLKARWSSVCGHYRFYVAMVRQSPVGELFELFKKVVK